jgi:histidinol dehydrogenase
VAADLVAQAEHDPQARATLVAADPDVVKAIEAALGAQVERAGRRAVVDDSLAHARAILVEHEDQALDVVNDLAPEHVSVMLEDAERFAGRIRNAGAIFVGAFTPVPFGDYGMASNHVLPTGGTARFASGLRAADFVKVTSVVKMSEEAAVRAAPEVAMLARIESLPGHAAAVEIRAQARKPS